MQNVYKEFLMQYVTQMQHEFINILVNKQI